MEKKIASGIILPLLLVGVLALAFNLQPAKAEYAYLADIFQLTTEPYGAFAPSWSPDGSHIAYCAFIDSWYRNTFAINPDGSGRTHITSGYIVDGTCDYSPDGARIVLQRWGLRSGNVYDLMTMNADGSNVEQITSTGLSRGEPRWSHDGQRIAFWYGPPPGGGPPFEIHIMDKDGTNEVTVATGSHPYMHPDWTADDSKLVYSDSDGLWLVNAFPPYEKTRLFETDSPTYWPVVSHDGKYILYGCGNDVSSEDLCLIDVAGNFIAQLTTNGMVCYRSDWSPDGQSIVFGSKRGGNYNVWSARIVISAPATVDIDPDVLNLRSNGQWITAYVQLPERYSAADIDASTIGLNGTIAPVLDPKYGFVSDPSEYLVDHNNDGVVERMVKFNRTMVSEYILSRGITYGNVVLTITGEIYDGTPFEGSDTIMVRMPGDVNSDGLVDIIDLATIGTRYGQSLTEPYYDLNEDGKTDVTDLAVTGVNYGKNYRQQA